MRKIPMYTVCSIFASFVPLFAQHKLEPESILFQGTILTEVITESKLVQSVMDIKSLDAERSISTKKCIIDTLSVSHPIVPFEQESHKTVIEINFDKVLMRTIVNDRGDTVQFYRQIALYLDEGGRKLLKVISYKSNQEHKAADLNSVDELEQKLLSKNVDFKGFPDSIACSFLSAFQNCPFSPHTAEKISAIYILDSSKADSIPRPLWIMSLIGMAPLKASGPFAEKVPSEMKNFIRVEIDGSTCQVVRASN